MFRVKILKIDMGGRFFDLILLIRHQQNRQTVAMALNIKRDFDLCPQMPISVSHFRILEKKVIKFIRKNQILEPECGFTM